MRKKFDGITKKFIEQIAEGMKDDDTDYQDIPFDEFKELIHYDGTAPSIRTIRQSVIIHMNEVGPCNWNFKVLSRNSGKTVIFLGWKKILIKFRMNVPLAPETLIRQTKKK